MNEEDAFIRAIQAAPNDAAPKLIYADWLEEHGQMVRAEFLRIMVELAKSNRIACTDSNLRKRYTQLFYETESNRHLQNFTPVQIDTTWRDLLVGRLSVDLGRDELLALGRLQGFLTSCALFNDHSSDMKYDFEVNLFPKITNVEEAVATYFSVTSHSSSWSTLQTRCELLEEGVQSLPTMLAQWLFHSYPLESPLGARWVNDWQRLGVTCEHGRHYFVNVLLSLIHEVLIPEQIWRVEFIGESDGWLALHWLALAVEAEDRILLLHFSFTD